MEAAVDTRGIYDKNGELFGYLIGKAVYDLDDNQQGVVRNGIVVDMNGSEMWRIKGDGLYTLKGVSMGYLGAQFKERQ
jgi:hypothetical protein